MSKQHEGLMLGRSRRLLGWWVDERSWSLSKEESLEHQHHGHFPLTQLACVGSTDLDLKD